MLQSFVCICHKGCSFSFTECQSMNCIDERQSVLNTKVQTVSVHSRISEGNIHCKRYFTDQKDRISLCWLDSQ